MTRYLSGPKGRIAGPFELFAAGRSVWTLMKVGAQRFRNRRTVVKLLDLDDRQLNDIGLTRADVCLSLALPYTQDPSSRLMFLALERRSARLIHQRDYDELMRPPQLRFLSGRNRSSIASISRW